MCVYVCIYVCVYIYIYSLYIYICKTLEIPYNLKKVSEKMVGFNFCVNKKHS